ncbi:MAG: carboxypeptidase regulatory-like domain-containing protein [bacterium]|jgi:hypothetical protein|nr:carboxypeptidase regulatory-like domain-containing protein [bacterium]
MKRLQQCSHAIRGKWLLCLLALLLIWLPACQQNKTGGVSGTVFLSQEENHEGVQVQIPGTQFRAITNAEGNFSIVGLPQGPYTAVISAEGYPEIRQEFEIAPAKTVSLQEIILSPIPVPVGVLVGIIHLTGESNHEGILVSLIGTPFVTRTDSNGFFKIESIPPGTYQVLAIKEAWLPATQDEIHIIDRQETQLPKLELISLDQLQARSEPQSSLGAYSIRGNAFLEGESAHNGIRVELADAPDTFTHTSEQGFFELVGLDEKPHSLILSCSGYIEQTIADVIPSPATTTSSAGFVTLQKDITASTGMGIMQGHVYLANQPNHANTIVRLLGVSQTVVTDTDGRYLFIGIPTGEYVLIAEHPGYAEGRLASVRVLPEQITPIPDLTLESSGESMPEGNGIIRGSAILEGESDHGGVTVAVGGTSLTTVTTGDGAYTLENVPFGAYTLIFAKGGYKNAYLEGIGVQVEQITQLEPVVLQKDIDPPFIVETHPQHSARRVPINRFVDVIVRFSERMNGEAVKRAAMITPPVTFDAFFDRESEFSDIDVLHMRLYQEGEAPVRFKTRYVVTITPDATTPKGIALAEPYFFGFTTDGPLIVNSMPMDGEGMFHQDMGQPLIIETNYPVDPQSVERAIRYRPMPDATPFYEFAQVGPGSRILINTNLRDNTRYRIQIDTNLRTIDGQRFSNTPMSISFRTSGPNERRTRSNPAAMSRGR